MKILLTGASGQLGAELQRSLPVLGEVLAPDSRRFNLARPESMVQLLREWRPQLVVNAAAYTAVDQAESEPAIAMAINARAPGVLAGECRRLDATLLHFSTDYVFDGLQSHPYAENDVPLPLNVYGRSKLAGEAAIREAGCRHLILRSGWFYGRGQGFVSRMAQSLATQQEVAVVDDQSGTPCWTRWLAETASALLASRNCREWPADSSLYHLAPAGFASRYELALAIRELSGAQGMPRPVPSSAFPLPAQRPGNSRLDCSRVEADFGLARPHWRELLAAYLETLPA